jgi:hypothetical protein
MLCENRTILTRIRILNKFASQTVRIRQATADYKYFIPIDKIMFYLYFLVGFFRKYD